MTLFEKMTCMLLDETSQKIKNGECVVTEETWKMAQKTLGHYPLSKEQACNYLHISRSTFDEKIRNRELPKGRKILGFTGLVWFQDELD